MRLKIGLLSYNSILLPIGFNEYLQTLIYNHLNNNNNNKKQIENDELTTKDRQFSLFTFSSILEKGIFNKTVSTYIYPHSLSFYISSPCDSILENLANNIAESKFIRFGNNKLVVNYVEIINQFKITKDSVQINAITPIVASLTSILNYKKKKNSDFSPFDKKFSTLINNNLTKKWSDLYNKKCTYKINIMPLFTGKKNEKIIYFGTGKTKIPIKGWLGSFLLQGDPELIDFACEAGLGEKNSEGFGMIDVMSDNN